MRLQLLTMGSALVLAATILFTLTAIDLSEARAQELRESPFLRETSLDSKDIFKKPKPIEDPTPEPVQEDILEEIFYPVPYAYTDYNNDGIVDLIREERNGKTYVYINQGSDLNPNYKGGIPFTGNKNILQYPDTSIQEKDTLTSSASSIESLTELNYPRFDVFIDTNYYNAYQENLTFYLDTLAIRFDLLESTTQWSSEASVGTKLKINVINDSLVCYGGQAKVGEVLKLRLSEPMFHPLCMDPYYVDGISYFGNPGELGDFWGYTEVGIHEATHGINPENWFHRAWFIEGFARYHGANILATYGDINQETADNKIFTGTSRYNWTGYVINDYHDGAGNEIQWSNGYGITSWMLSMLRDDYSLDWNSFYTLMKNNPETFDQSKVETTLWYQGNYTDMVLIDMFGRTLGMDFDEITAIFRYDGPSGPGWGVREWMPIDWYADLVPEINVSATNVLPGETINVNVKINNNGNTTLENVSIQIYSQNALTGETIQLYQGNELLLNHNNINLPFQISEAEKSYLTINVLVDEDNIKMETNEKNNIASQRISFTEPICIMVKIPGTKIYQEQCRIEVNPWD